MKYAELSICFAFLPAIGFSAPPQRCDDAPAAVVFPQTPSPRTDTPSQDPHSPAAEPTRRQRIQSLIDRVNKLKPNLDNPPPPPAADEEPPLLIEPPVVGTETSSSDSPPASASPLPVNPPVLDAPDPAPLPVQPLMPAPESVSQSATEPPVDQPPPESPLLLPKDPMQEASIPTPAVSEISPGREDSPLTLPTELLDQAIDRQRMGNNLYAIGAYELALMNYEKMLQQPLSPVEAQWAQFQVANCQRQLGQLAQAQKAYRRVAGETAEDWLGQMSRWWLKELDEREQLHRRVAELDQITQTLQQELNRAP